MLHFLSSLSAVYEAGGDKLLVQLLQNGSPAAVLQAAAVLNSMASQEVLRSSILSHGAMRALVKPLHSTDKPTLFSAIQAVAALACDAEGRAEVCLYSYITGLQVILLD